jgi:hypothetical protein
MKSSFDRAVGVWLVVVSFLLFGSSMSASPVEQPRITHIRFEVGQVVVTAEIPPGIRKVTLESRPRLGSVGWEPRQVARLAEVGAQLEFRLPASDQLEVLRLRADETELFPAEWYQGTNSGFPQPTSSGGWGGDWGYGVPVWREVDAGAPEAAREVVESDIWQIEGDMLYFFNQYRGLQAISLESPDTPQLMGTLTLPAAGEQMYVLETGHLVLLTTGSCYYQESGMESELLILTVPNGQPEVVGRVPVAGRIQESRLVGTALYVAAQTYREVAGSEGTTWEWGTRLSAFDFSDPLAPVARNVLWYPGYNQVVSATDSFFFLATQDANDWRRSVVHLVDIEDPSGQMLASGRVHPAGLVADKFKIQLEGEVLTIISEVRDTTLHTLLETFSLSDPAAPRKLGELMLGPSEQLHATRFAGDKVYVVTFFVQFQMDPLWVVDLSQPEEPRILGELEIPGWSTYLHPWGDRLVACGIETNQTTVSLFDVEDPAHPALLKRVTIGTGWSWSEANNDEKAFRVLPEFGLILLPYQSWDEGVSTTRVQLIDLTPDDLIARGTIDHLMTPRRATLHRDRVVSVSGLELLSADIADRDRPRVTAQLALAWPVDWVFVRDDFLIELSRGSTGDIGAEHPVIRVALATAPDAVMSVVPIPRPWPLLAAEVQGERLYLVQGMPWTPPPEEDPAPTDEPQANLSLTVFDLSRLPELPILGETALIWEALGWGSEFQVVWPKEGLLVLAGGGGGYWYPWLDWGFRPVGGDVAVPGGWWPNYWGSNGGRLLAFDVGDANAPVLASQVDLTTEGWWNFSKASVAGGLVYVTHTIAEPASAIVYQDASNGEWRTNQPPEWLWVQRSFLDVIDYADPAEPVVRRPVETPGGLAGVSVNGAVIYTIGARWQPAPDWSNDATEWLDASIYDGVSLHLLDSLQLPTSWPRPLLIDLDVILLGRAEADGAGSLETWVLGSEGKLARVDLLKLEVSAQVLSGLGDLLVAQTNDRILLLDRPEPARPRLIGGGIPPGCVWPDLRHAVGDPRRGAWIPLGYNGVWRLPVGSTF